MSKYTVTKNFGEFIKQARKQKGLTMIELAEIINSPTTTTRSMQVHIAKWESGKVFPRAEYLETLSKVLEFKIILFAGGKTTVITDEEKLHG